MIDFCQHGYPLLGYCPHVDCPEQDAYSRKLGWALSQAEKDRIAASDKVIQATILRQLP